MKKAFIQVVPNRFFEVALVLIQGLDRQLGDYLRSRLIQTIIISIIAAIGYWILGITVCNPHRNYRWTGESDSVYRSIHRSNSCNHRGLSRLPIRTWLEPIGCYHC